MVSGCLGGVRRRCQGQEVDTVRPTQYSTANLSHIGRRAYRRPVVRSQASIGAHLGVRSQASAPGRYRAAQTNPLPNRGRGGAG
jgi:hypothetical protein